MKAVEHHKEVFGEFNANIIGLNFQDPAVESRILDAVDNAIASGFPVTPQDIDGEPVPDDALI